MCKTHTRIRVHARIIKGSRVCKPFNVLAVRKYVRASMVKGYTTMHFMSDRAPITLHTDASDYGVGGYLFQTVDGIDQSVAFVSRSLNKSQLRWSVIQK